MKVIDTLYKLAQGNIITVNTNEFFRKLTANMTYKELMEGLNSEVEIIEDTPTISKLYVNNELQYDLTPKEDKIEKLDIGDELFSLINNGFEEHSMHKMLKLIELKLNEIIDKINGGKDEKLIHNN